MLLILQPKLVCTYGFITTESVANMLTTRVNNFPISIPRTACKARTTDGMGIYRNLIVYLFYCHYQFLNMDCFLQSSFIRTTSVVAKTTFLQMK